MSTTLLEETNLLSAKERLNFTNLLKSQHVTEFQSIATAINSNDARQVLFHASVGSNAVPCCKCGTVLSWHTDNREYRKFCSKACTAKYTVADKKVKNLATLGVEWHSQTPSWTDKVKLTSIKKFGTEHYSKSLDYANAVKETVKLKYGVDHVMDLDSIKTKIANTCNIRYGVANAAQSKDVQDKIKKTNLDRYGFENAAQSKNVQDKIKQTNLDRYGFENAAQSPTIRTKITSTYRTNYYLPEVLDKITDKLWLEGEHQSGKPVWQIAEELGVSSSNLCKIFHNLNINIVSHQYSAIELKLADYFMALGYNVVCNSRSIIAPKELDLFFPDYNLAIEVNGCYYHSEQFNKFKDYHLQKTNECAAQGITLLQFWDTELYNNWDQVINFINSKLIASHISIYARHTKVKILNSKDKSQFVVANHLQGDVNSAINLGLFDTKSNKLVMVATFGKPRFTKNPNIVFELLRLCSAQGTQVVGGASKLLAYFKQHYMIPNNVLVSYCNRRYSIGNVYYSLGFTLSHIAPPSFFYINSAGNYAGTRYQWQKHLMAGRLANFNSNITADQNMANNGYAKVWDCGQYVFHLSI